MRDTLDAQQHQRRQDRRTVGGTARASGMTDG